MWSSEPYVSAPVEINTLPALEVSHSQGSSVQAFEKGAAGGDVRTWPLAKTVPDPHRFRPYPVRDRRGRGTMPSNYSNRHPSRSNIACK